MKRLIKRLMEFLVARVLNDDGPKVIFYHDVGRAYTPMGTPTDVFKQHILSALSLDYVFTDGLPGRKRELQLCFDDGFRGIWDVRSFFKEHKLRPTVFLPITLVGQKGYLNWQEILILQNEYGFNCQAHTWSHQTLSGDFIDNSPIGERTDSWFEKELLHCRQELERRLNKEIVDLCFPAGSFSPEVVKRCIAAGYRKLYTSLPSSTVDVVLPDGIFKKLPKGDYRLIARHLCQNMNRSAFIDVLKGSQIPFLAHYLKQHWSEK